MHAVVSAQPGGGVRDDEGEQGPTLDSGQRAAAHDREHGSGNHQRVWRRASRSSVLLISPRRDLLRVTDRGLYCEAGDFHIDPWQPVERALITHAHGDHARWGSKSYLSSTEGERVLRTRLGAAASVSSVAYSEERTIRDVRVSFHPAGH